MTASDDDFINDASDDDDEDVRASRRRPDRKTRSKGAERQKESEWEVSRTWEALEEGADGTLTGAVEGLLEAGKRKRLLKDTTPLQRGIIRHLILIIDLSIAMLEKDLRPTRHLLTLRYTQEFITEFFEQNPISQLGIICMRDGLAHRVSPLSGNPTEHLTAIANLRNQSSPKYLDPKGNPSLENALEMARASLFHAPSHGTREILLVFGALHSADPGDIHITIASLVNDRIRARVISLAASLAICSELVTRTNDGDKSGYSVVLNEQHFRELMMDITTPPVTQQSQSSTADTSASTLLMMGFPSRTISAHPSLCACHAKPSRDGYLCSRCTTKVCSLPSECPTCGLTLILSTHLARSYHHLFPLVNWADVPWRDAWRSTTCFACGKPFPDVPPRTQWDVDGTTISGRYECPVCRKHFCVDCDLFAHEVVHNCPGCQSGGAKMGPMGEDVEGPQVENEEGDIAVRANGNGTRANGDAEAMDVDG